MKKTSSLVVYCTFILCTIIIFSLNSCSEEAVEEVAVTKPEPIGLSAEKSKYAPYEIVTISASENLFTVQSFSAKINDIEIIVGTYEKIASFVLPNLNNGNYNLNFTLNDKNYIVPITVSSLTNILSADQYFNDIQTSINQNINELNLQITQLVQNSTNQNEYTNLQNDVIKYTKLFNDYKVSYNNLSAVEKQEFAKSMAANKAIIDKYNTLTAALNSSNALLRTAQPVQDYEEAVELSANQFIDCLEYTIAHVPIILIGAKLAATPTGIFSIGATIATGLVVTSFMFNVSNTAAAAVTLTNKSLVPFEIIAQNSQTRFSSGVETVTDFQAKYRSLIASDGSNAGNGSTIHSIAESFTQFKDKYNGFMGEIPSIFRPSYVMTSLKSTFNSTTRSIFNKYVGITNISNPNVTLQQLNQSDGNVIIKATTTATSDQAFTYDVNYTNSSFTNGLKKTMDAVVSVYINPWIAIMVGTWDYQHYYQANDDAEFAVVVKTIADNIHLNPCGWTATPIGDDPILGANTILNHAPRIRHEFIFSADLKLDYVTYSTISNIDCTIVKDYSLNIYGYSISETGYINTVTNLPLRGQVEIIDDNTLVIKPIAERTYFLLKRK